MFNYHTDIHILDQYIEYSEYNHMFRHPNLRKMFLGHIYTNGICLEVCCLQ